MISASQILEDVIVELKLPFEGAIGHAATPLKHGHGFIHKLLKGHG